MKTFSLSTKEIAALGISGAGLTVSGLNYATNRKRLKESTEYQKQSLKAMENLTESLKAVDKSLKEKKIIDPEKKKRKGIFRFIQKNNSRISDYALKGGALGGAIAGGAIPFLPDKIGVLGNKEVTTTSKKPGRDSSETIYEKTEGIVNINDPNFRHPKFREKYNKLNTPVRNALMMVGGVAIGATLGAIAGAIMDLTDHIVRKKTVNNRLMKDVLVNLKKMGFNEGRDYTRDPKISTLLKTKVCLVISKSSDEIKLLVNTVNERGLKDITSSISKNLPTMSTVTEKVSDKYNELNITTMTSNNGDSTWVASIAEKFIKAGYPVYLVEVG